MSDNGLQEYSNRWFKPLRAQYAEATLDVGHAVNENLDKLAAEIRNQKRELRK